jgi:hypothetical protein
MAKVQLKTAQNDGDVGAFLAGVEPPQRQADARTVSALLADVTGCPPTMWGASIIGFDSYTYRSPATGRSGDWFVVGCSPRKANLVVYVMAGFDEYEGMLARLGTHSTGKSCLYLKRLADVDLEVLRELVVASVTHVRANHPSS